jgi:hypothetical protein
MNLGSQLDAVNEFLKITDKGVVPDSRFYAVTSEKALNEQAIHSMAEERGKLSFQDIASIAGAIESEFHTFELQIGQKLFVPLEIKSGKLSSQKQLVVNLSSSLDTITADTDILPIIKEMNFHWNKKETIFYIYGIGIENLGRRFFSKKNAVSPISFNTPDLDLDFAGFTCWSYIHTTTHAEYSHKMCSGLLRAGYSCTLMPDDLTRLKEYSIEYDFTPFTGKKVCVKVNLRYTEDKSYCTICHITYGQSSTTFFNGMPYNIILNNDVLNPNILQRTINFNQDISAQELSAIEVMDIYRKIERKLDVLGTIYSIFDAVNLQNPDIEVLKNPCNIVKWYSPNNKVSIVNTC